MFIARRICHVFVKQNPVMQIDSQGNIDGNTAEQLDG